MQVGENAPDVYPHDINEDGIFSALNALDETLSYLETHSSELASALSPILRKNGGSEGDSSNPDSIRQVDGSDVARRILSLDERLIAVNNSLVETKNRIHL